MHIRAESKILTLGDLKMAIEKWEMEGYKDEDLINPPAEWLNSETNSDDVQKVMSPIAQMANAIPKSVRHAGVVLYVVRKV